MLYAEAMEPCRRVVTFKESDGQGGWRTSEITGEEFKAAVVMDASSDAAIAESERMVRTYTVTAPIGTGLGFFEEFRRDSDGQRFRVLSVPSDRTTPARATFAFEQVRAEAVDG